MADVWTLPQPHPIFSSFPLMFQMLMRYLVDEISLKQTKQKGEGVMVCIGHRSFTTFVLGLIH